MFAYFAMSYDSVAVRFPLPGALHQTGQTPIVPDVAARTRARRSCRAADASGSPGTTLRFSPGLCLTRDVQAQDRAEESADLSARQVRLRIGLVSLEASHEQPYASTFAGE